MAWLVASLRRLRDERATTVALVALVFVTALVFAAAPRLFEGIADDAVQTQVARGIVVRSQRPTARRSAGSRPTARIRWRMSMRPVSTSSAPCRPRWAT